MVKAVDLRTSRAACAKSAPFRFKCSDSGLRNELAIRNMRGNG